MLHSADEEFNPEYPDLILSIPRIVVFQAYPKYHF